MSEKIFKILLEEFKRNGVKLIEHDFRGDVFISDPADIVHETFERQCTTIPQLLDFSEHDKVFEDKIEKLEKQIANMRAEKNTLRIRCMESARDKFDKKMYGCLSIVSYPKEIENENKALKQRIVELEKELEEWKEEARVVKKQRDEQLKSFRKGIEPYVDLLHMHETIADKNEKIAELEKGMVDYKQAFEDKCSDYDATLDDLDEFIAENEELKQRIAELESELEKKECIKTMRIEFHADNGEMLTPLEVANALINQNTFKVDELKEIAEHLEVYCRHNRQRCDEPIAF